jgi:hypothetical protein
MVKNYCLEVEFIDVDFNSYSITGKTQVSKVHHAHLDLSDNDIELKIFFDPRSYFDHKFTEWIGEISSNKLGSFLKVELSKEDWNEGLQKVDLSEAKLIKYISSTTNIANGHRYIILKIDTVKLYWNPFENEMQLGEFYLGDKGFKVLESFYSPLFPKTCGQNDGQFEIGRMNAAKIYYELDKSKFRPEFNFITNDDRSTRTATVKKEPKIQFYYKNGATEKEAIFYGDVVLLLASFYHHMKIDYTFRTIHLPEQTIQIKNVEQKKFIDFNENLRGFGIKGDFNSFLQLSWQKETVKNFALLHKAVTMFNQSHLVDSYSTFLIRYNIIEICSTSNEEDRFWNFTIEKEKLDHFFEETKNNISNNIDKNEQEQFNNKWNSILKIIKTKPLKKQLEYSLTKNGIDLETLPIKTGKVVELRNNITHGSIDKVKSEDLRKGNILLYRISGIIILNLMGIKDWKLNLTIPQ